MVAVERLFCMLERGNNSIAMRCKLSYSIFRILWLMAHDWGETDTWHDKVYEYFCVGKVALIVLSLVQEPEKFPRTSYHAKLCGWELSSHISNKRKLL